MRASSPIAITAALSLAVLIGAIGIKAGNIMGQSARIVDTSALEPVERQNFVPTDDNNRNGVPDWQDELSSAGVAIATTTATSTLGEITDRLEYVTADVANMLYGGYVSLKQYDSYTPARADELGNRVAASIVAPEDFVPHTVNELQIHDDTSEAQVLKYRSHMREALASMVTSDGPEFELFARYLETRDPLWLQALLDASDRYRIAEEKMLLVQVPKDAASEHLRALNATGAYARTLEHMAAFKSDNAFSYMALLKTHSNNEEQLLTSFNSLAQYYVRKVTN